MDLDRAREHVRAHHRAVLATLRRDGAPQLSPVLAGVDDGNVVVSSWESTAKVRNLQRDPRVWLCVLQDTFFGDWVQVAGRAQVVTLPEAMDGLVAYYRAVAGEHPDWDDYRAAMQRERRVLIRISLTGAGPDGPEAAPAPGTSDGAG